MTNDEIIKQLESLLSHCKSMIEKDGGFPIWEKDCEALEAAIAALRPTNEPPIDREKWTAEWIWQVDDDGCTWLQCTACDYSLDSLEDEPKDFCPGCGRAMTPKAWAELEKRLRSVNHG